MVVGPGACGKTAFLRRILTGVYSPYQCITIYYDMMLWSEKLVLFDMAGSDKYHDLLGPMFKGADAFLLCLDCEHLESADGKQWVSFIRETSQAPIFLVRLKADLLPSAGERAMAKRRVLGTIDLGVCSAKTDDHPEQILDWIVRALQNHRVLAALAINPNLCTLSRDGQDSQAIVQKTTNTQGQSCGSQSSASPHASAHGTSELSNGA
jgi:GTPase SAR1 family protein